MNWKRFFVALTLFFPTFIFAEEATITKQEAIKTCKAEGNKGLKLQACVKSKMHK